MLKDLNITYSTHTLSNNIRLDVYTKPSSPVILRFSLLAGDSFHDDKSKKGLAHFVEHILLAGTDKFPSKDKIALHMDKYGGEFGGQTDRERIFFDLRVASGEDAEQIFIVLQEMLAHSLMSEKIISTERASVVTEYKQRTSRPSYKVGLKSMEQMFTETPLSIPTLGYLENIEKFSAKDVREYLQNNLLGGKIGICIAGDISTGDAVRLCEKYLSFIPHSENYRINPETETELPENFKPENKLQLIESEEDSTNICIGMRAPKFYHPNKYAYGIINNITASRRGSLLVRKLRYDLGLVYSIGSSLTYFRSSGDFSIRTDVKPELTSQVISEILNFLQKDIWDEFTEEIFETEKHRILAVNKTGLESVSQLISGGYLFTTTTVEDTYDDVLAGIASVTYNDAKEALKELLAPEKNIYITHSGKEIARL